MQWPVHYLIQCTPLIRKIFCFCFEINRSWRISTTPNTTKIFLSLSNLYSNLIWSFWVALRRKIRFVGMSALKTQLSVINWTFFPRIQILIFFFREATQNDHIRLLYKFERDKIILVVLEVVDMCQLLLKNI